MAGDIEARLAAYASDLPSQAIAQIQLELLNREWARTVKRIPFYSKLVAANAAPEEFESLEHFFAVAPMANRPLIHQHAAAMCDQSRGPGFMANHRGLHFAAYPTPGMARGIRSRAVRHVGRTELVFD